MRTLNEAAIDKIVATCNGDLRGALKALLLVNEQLEAELAQLYAVVSPGGLDRRPLKNEEERATRRTHSGISICRRSACRSAVLRLR